MIGAFDTDKRHNTEIDPTFLMWIKCPKILNEIDKMNVFNVNPANQGSPIILFLSLTSVFQYRESGSP
jgi:hypothetical protein